VVAGAPEFFDVRVFDRAGICVRAILVCALELRLHLFAEAREAEVERGWRVDDAAGLRCVLGMVAVVEDRRCQADALHGKKRVETAPPTVATENVHGSWPSVRSCGCRAASTSARTHPASAHTQPASASTSRTRLRRADEMTMPGRSERAPPMRPVPAP